MLGGRGGSSRLQRLLGSKQEAVEDRILRSSLLYADVNGQVVVMIWQHTANKRVLLYGTKNRRNGDLFERHPLCGGGACGASVGS